MSRWVRGIYNAAANFVLSGSLRAARGSSLDRRDKHVQDGSNQSRKCIESNQSSESVKSSNECGSDTDCLGCAPFSCARNDPNSKHYTNIHVEGCICSICREYHEYTSYTASIRTEGQGFGARIRFSNESRSFKQPYPDATRTDIESVTGIPTGTTI